MVMTSSKQKRPDLTIVIPAYREEKRIGRTLNQLAAFLKRDSFFSRKAVEVLVVAADAPDKTQEIVIAKQKQFSNLQLLKSGPKVGKGRDVQYGMLRARGRFVVFMDADLATPLHHLEEFYRSCAQSNDLVIGTRNLLTYRPNVLRRVVSIAGNILFRLASDIRIEDSQCGFKMFRKSAATLCFSKLSIFGWGFDMEILAIAHVNKLTLRSYRIDDWKDMPNSTFTDGTLKTSLLSLGDLCHIAIYKVRGAYIDQRTRQKSPN
jgi:dolichyl-phosphate beta-glucosyltransferase